jgi:hypothetical protein
MLQIPDTRSAKLKTTSTASPSKSFTKLANRREF